MYYREEFSDIFCDENNMTHKLTMLHFTISLQQSTKYKPPTDDDGNVVVTIYVVVKTLK